MQTNPITDALIEAIFKAEPVGSMIRAGCVRAMRGTIYWAVCMYAEMPDYGRRWSF